MWKKFWDARREAPMSVEEYFVKLKSRGLNADGTPILDPTPLAPPIGYVKHPSMVEIVRNMVRGERLRQEAEAAGAETFEEADDFDIGDDGEDLRSGFENDHDPPIEELLKAGREALAEKEAKAKTKAEASHTPSPPQPPGA